MILIWILIALFLLAAAAPFINILARRFSGWVLSLLPFGAFAFFLTKMPAVSDGELIFESVPWISYFNISFSLQLDGLGLLFALLVTGIGGFILVYSGYYMQAYKNTNRFYAYLVFFLASMLGLVLSSNLITMFVFWEFTSISSFLLIGFFHEKQSSRDASLQALLITGIGGLALLGGFILMAIPYGSYELNEMLNDPSILANSEIFVPALLLILIGAFTKSAIFPFHFWLPQAMAGPSPVSAFLHSATMVKAGIFLLARLNPLMEWSELWFYSLTIFGSLTMFAGAWFSVLQTDIKKILAYTTISALGTLTLLIGVNTKYSLNAFVIFLIVHAFYKATLFMMAGTIDKKTGERDIDRLGGLFHYMPVAATIMIIALLSMAGLPPMLGFIGKELIYGALAGIEFTVPIVLILAFFTNTFMVFVSLRLGIDIFWGKKPAFIKKPAEPGFALLAGPGFLVLLSLFLGLYPGIIETNILIPALDAINPEVKHVPMKIWHGFNLILLLSAITFASGYAMYHFRGKFMKAKRDITSKYFGTQLSTQFFWLINYFLLLAKKKTRLTQHGYLRLYLTTIFIVACALILFMIWNNPPDLAFDDIHNIPLYMHVVAIVIIVSALKAVLSKSKLIALISLGIAGFGISMIFITYSAIDLAITMIMVETLMVIIGALVVFHLPEYKPLSTRLARRRDMVVATVFGITIAVLVIVSGSLLPADRISEYMVLNSYTKGFGKNIVNVILVDFRALDTLGEIAVLSLAGIGIFALLKINVNQTK